MALQRVWPVGKWAIPKPKEPKDIGDKMHLDILVLHIAVRLGLAQLDLESSGAMVLLEGGK